MATNNKSQVDIIKLCKKDSVIRISLAFALKVP